MEEKVSDICEKKELVELTEFLVDEIKEKALNKGIRIVFDMEPVFYESVLSLYAIAANCSKAILTGEKGVVVGPDGKRYRLAFSLFEVANPGENEIMVVFMRERPKKFWDDFELLVAQPRLIFFIVTRRQLEVNVSTAVYFRNLAAELMAKTFDVMKEDTKDERWELKKRYIGRVPFDALLLYPLDVVEKIARTWVPPPPPNADYLHYLHKKSRRLSHLVLPDPVRQELERFIKLARAEGRGSILLVGLPASGRKTIASAIAAELGLPAYHISITNILSRWVGESESKLKEFFEGMRTRGGVAVFENVEFLFREDVEESVISNLRAILYQEMTRDDNNFIIVFTSNEDAPPKLFKSLLIGEVKLIIPPPNAKERRELARKFILEILGEHWDKLMEIAKRQHNVGNERAEESLFSLYADSFVEHTAGMTSGELYRSMRRVLIPTLDKILKEGKLVSIDDDVLSLSKRDYTARLAKLKTLKEKADSLRLIEVADIIVEVMKEVEKKARERLEGNDEVRGALAHEVLEGASLT